MDLQGFVPMVLGFVVWTWLEEPKTSGLVFLLIILMPIFTGSLGLLSRELWGRTQVPLAFELSP